MSTRRPWWHCSQGHQEPRWTARRIVPPCAGPKEPPVPRLCVSGSLAGALAARHWQEGRDIAVYLTEPRRAIRPTSRQVWDAPITGERWVVPPVELRRIDFVPRQALEHYPFPMVRLGGVTPLERARVLLSMCALVRDLLPQHRDRRVEGFARACYELCAREENRRRERDAIEMGFFELDEAA